MKWLVAFLLSFALVFPLFCGGEGDDSPSGSVEVPDTSTPDVSEDSTDDEPSFSRARVELVRVFANLGFSEPTALLQAPGDDSRWFVVEREGRVRIFSNKNEVTDSRLFIDISDRVNSNYSEGGLLGMAFHPDFQDNNEVVLSYTRTGSPLVSYISGFVSVDNGLTLDSASEQKIITLPQPYKNHNGGGIAFGPDGYLYIGFGDGGSGGDPRGNGQNLNTLLGAILRIDVDGAATYAIPPDNPFASGGGRGEIYAWGLRNPWRFSFDRDTDQLWAGDVGQDMWEEIDIIQSGGNYGWKIREGAYCYESESCDTGGLIDPVAEYTRDDGCTVIGGYVYRGESISDLRGVYIFGDFCSGKIWGLNQNDNGDRSTRQLIDSDITISSFGEDNDGELYVLDYGGEIYRLEPSIGGD